ncbi:DUF4097 family beta strand repeat-containing protein [Actinopolyspora mortivallis]|uniref:DUF4097 family beta strand repeat-containing protein n=1 Tax=Actinopolyspora mortivallis TaxID=33906 RepID=UPI0011B299E5|nr:DUF4097 family beta strand repeat-containing protein [Actinopolyspora mortivallis]
MLLDLRLAAGSVEVTVEDREHAEAVLRLRVPEPPAQSVGVRQVVADTVTSTVVVNGRVVSGGGATVARGRGEVVATARLPRDSSLASETISAWVTARGPLERAEITTVSGDVDVHQAQRVELISTSGDALLVEADDVVATTVSGDLRIDHTRTAWVTSGSGNVWLLAHAPHQPATVWARTVSGDIRVLATETTGPLDCRVGSVSGDVRERV